MHISPITKGILCILTGLYLLVSAAFPQGISFQGSTGGSTGGSSYTTFTDSADGLAPASGGGTTKYLRADQTWVVPPDTTYSTFGDLTDGLVPNPGETAATKFLRQDGTWVVPTDTTYSNFSSGSAGLAPASGGGTDKFLRADVSFASPHIVGEIKLYTGSEAPSGWTTCDGTALSRSTYSSLFAVCGTTYGVGDGSTTFNVPDLRGSVPVGDGTGSGLTARAMGDSGGEESHSLTEAELASHYHLMDQNVMINNANTGTNKYNVLTSGANWCNPMGETSFNRRTGTAGSGTAHNTMQPYLVIKYIIFTGI